jgi:hypothetical protein
MLDVRRQGSEIRIFWRSKYVLVKELASIVSEYLSGANRASRQYRALSLCFYCGY